LTRYLTALALVLSLSPTLVSATPQRIISLAPHATELAFAAGLGGKLIAVSEFSDYPEQAKSIERVANYQGVKLERIISLKPDLILVWPAGNPMREVEKLEQFGFNLHYSTTKSLTDIADNIEALSEYADDPSIGQQAAEDFRQQLTNAKQRYTTDVAVSYFYQLSEKPIITVAQNNWPSVVFEFCGGQNVFEKSPVPYPQVSIEQVIVRQPQAIFTSEHAIANGNMWDKWRQQLPAVGQGHLWSLTSDWLNRPTPRTLRAIEEVCEHLQHVRNSF
jgi:vitamin B12 transport system substrate-binding protein